jgi:ATP/maltotriose-dependent transcriptional regulator MalT
MGSLCVQQSMVDLLYKVHTPQRPCELVTRSRLLDLIAVPPRRLVALVAPAGYGKTSLMLDFAHTTSLPVCWYTIDEYDADPWVFLRYLTASVQQRFPDSLRQTWQMLESEGRPLLRAVTTAFVREVSVIGETFVLCLDDWHLVNDVPAISEFVAQIVGRCPNSAIVLTSRTHPTLPNQMLLAARRQFATIDETQLRFSAQELTAAISSDVLEQPTPEQAEWLCDQSDGWISSVLLALQTTGGDVASILANRMKLHRPVQRFLAEQVLSRQPADLQTFLCETSLFDELTAERCDAVLQRHDSRRMLETLLARRLFVRETEPGALRYHSLFRECLRSHFQNENRVRFQEIGIRIAEDYARHHQWSQAFELCAAIGDWPAARQILRTGGDVLYAHGQLETLEHAFVVLPPDAFDDALLCLKAKVALERGQADQARAFVDQAAQLVGTTPSPLVYLHQAILARMDGRFEQACVYAEQALDLMPDPEVRGAALRNLGISQYRLGRSAEAFTTLQCALDLEQERGATAAIAQVEHELVIYYHSIGDVRSAEAFGRRAEQRWTAIGNLGGRALTRNSLAVNLTYSGRYVEAYTTICDALHDAYLTTVTYSEAAALSTLGDIYVALGCWEYAAAVFDGAMQTGGTAAIRSHIVIAQAGLLALQRHYIAARQTLQQRAQWILPQHEPNVLLFQAYIAGGLGDVEGGLRQVTLAIRRYVQTGALIGQIRGHAVCAWLQSLAVPVCEDALLAELHEVARLADQLGSDAPALVFLQTLREKLQRLQTCFPRASDWIQQMDCVERMRGELPFSILPPLPSLAGLQRLLNRPVVAVQPAQICYQPGLRAWYLGGDQIWVNNTPLALGPGRPREALAYLIVHPRGATRAELYRALWGEEETPDDSNALSRVIYRLRAALPEGAIVTVNRDTYQLDREAVQVDADVEMFEQTLDAAAQDVSQRFSFLQKALDLYQGPFLGDANVPWCFDVRARLERRYRQALRQTAEQNEMHGQYQQALELFHQVLQRDSANIAAHTGAMRCYVILGEPAQAIAQYRSLTDSLDEELGLELDPESEAERIYQTLLAV